MHLSNKHRWAEALPSHFAITWLRQNVVRETETVHVYKKLSGTQMNMHQIGYLISVALHVVDNMQEGTYSVWRHRHTI